MYHRPRCCVQLIHCNDCNTRNSCVLLKLNHLLTVVVLIVPFCFLLQLCSEVHSAMASQYPAGEIHTPMKSYVSSQYLKVIICMCSCCCVSFVNVCDCLQVLSEKMRPSLVGRVEIPVSADGNAESRAVLLTSQQLSELHHVFV